MEPFPWGGPSAHQPEELERRGGREKYLSVIDDVFFDVHGRDGIIGILENAESEASGDVLLRVLHHNSLFDRTKL